MTTPQKDELELAYQVIVNHIQGENATESEKTNFQGTAARAAKALREMVLTRDEMTSKLNSILSVGFPTEKNSQAGMITQGPIKAHSICPHHLLPVIVECYVSYIPSSDGRVLGLSKLSRMVKVLAKRGVLQEQLTSDIADCLFRNLTTDSPFPSIKSNGAAVQLLGKHLCMACRGVHEDSVTLTTELRGSYWEGDLEQKFYQAVASIRASSVL